MKKLFIICLSILLFTNTNAQENSELKFETNFYDAVGGWVVLPKKSTDTIYTYGFIYMDISAGITFHLGGSFYIDKNKKYIGDEQPAHQMMKKRLDNPNIVKMAVLSDHKLKELNLSKEPDWLSSYKFSEDSIENLKQLGYHFNHVGACEKALLYLNKAYKKDPHYKGLEFEISYAYNHLGQYDKSIPVLEKALKNDSKNYSFYRELGYAYSKQSKLDMAEKTYKKGISLSESNFEKSEMALNMAQGYFLVKNKAKFDEWAKITRTYAEKDSQYAQYIDFFEKEWDSKR
jgi:tetratricopeptide (TPR) repeat protein